ncbi:hypothetical protein COCNU_06G002220 [Cocos nucifera]|uniref:Phosphorylated adapter RNA export protein n=1 Tax=Cocos nucifera TaxID=13894 RepID=A0A8K0I9Q8_COCNU|nr:hypothetical protein COCNU_06G002220 [Cocos nucifera]
MPTVSKKMSRCPPPNPTRRRTAGRSAGRGPRDRNQRRRVNKKNQKKKKGGAVSSITDINRQCWRLKERKSYLVWNAVGCLGVSAFSNLVKEVETIQNCGGQTTADTRC